jgi:GTP cyclohydrolase I
VSPKPVDLAVAQAVRTILRAAEGENCLRPGLQETPERFARAWEFFTSGYHQNPASVLKSFEDGAQGYDEMVVVNQIPVMSLCEHHAIPFFGHAHIAYIPNGRVLGLSKFARLVEVFARRLQVQERLTVQIADALQEHLKPKGVGVILECRHLCLEMRGVRTPGSITITDALRGTFCENTVRQEFLSLRTGRV